MKEFDKNKYKIFKNEEKGIVIAVSTYAGKNVKGIAKCDPRDTFDFEKGKELAISRCNAKIAEKRRKRAYAKKLEAEKILAAAEKHMMEMLTYYHDSCLAEDEAKFSKFYLEKYY